MSWDSQKPGILKICRKKLTRIRTAQGSMLMDTKNEGGYIPSATHGLKKADGLGINTPKEKA